MKVLYFDCSSGIAGNMILGALIDAGVSPSYLKKGLKKLPIHEKYKLDIKKIKKYGIQSTYVDVKILSHEHGKKLKDIIKIINKSKLNKKIKDKSISIFKHICAAEFKVHGEEHLHDIGCTDTLIDIVGTVICVEKLNIGEIYSSAICTGSGNVNTCHGIMPVPAPATALLLKNIPIYSGNIEKELTTPTGAGIISFLTKTFKEIPRIIIKEIGYGAGSHDLESQANVLRVIIGEKEIGSLENNILQIETNIDDMDLKLYDKTIAELMKAGALDTFIEPIRMKKKRSAFKLVILCKIEDKENMLENLFKETTTIGTRIFLVKREVLKRKIEQFKGELFKNAYLNSTLINSKPE